MYSTRNATTVKMFHLYEITAAHNRIALFFTLEKRIYMAMLDALKLEWVETDFIVNENSGELIPALRLSMNQKDYLRLRDFHGAKCFGFEKDFFKEWEETKKETRENKGDYIERKFVETFHAKASQKGIAYYEKGDCELFGEEIQIKYGRATLAKFETIETAAKIKGL